MEIGIRIFALLLDIGFGTACYFFVFSGTAWILDRIGYAGFVVSPLMFVLFLRFQFYTWPSPQDYGGKLSVNLFAGFPYQITWASHQDSGGHWAGKH